MTITDKEIAKYIARGLIETGVEGGFDAVSCSTAGDYPSIGTSQWEGERANSLLSYIDGGDYYAHRSYSDLEESDELDEERPEPEVSESASLEEDASSA